MLQVELVNAEAQRSLHDRPRNPDVIDLTMPLQRTSQPRSLAVRHRCTRGRQCPGPSRSPPGPKHLVSPPHYLLIKLGRLLIVPDGDSMGGKLQRLAHDRRIARQWAGRCGSGAAASRPVALRPGRSRPGSTPAAQSRCRPNRSCRPGDAPAPLHGRSPGRSEAIGRSTRRLRPKPRGRRPSTAALTISGVRKASNRVIRIERTVLPSRKAIDSKV